MEQRQDNESLENEALESEEFYQADDYEDVDRKEQERLDYNRKADLLWKRVEALKLSETNPVKADVFDHLRCSNLARATQKVELLEKKMAEKSSREEEGVDNASAISFKARQAAGSKAAELYIKGEISAEEAEKRGAKLR